MIENIIREYAVNLSARKLVDAHIIGLGEFKKLVDEIELLLSVFVRSFIVANMNNVNNAEANFTTASCPNKHIDEIKNLVARC